VDDVPRVLDVLKALQANFVIGKVVMAEEFRQVNSSETLRSFERCVGDVETIFEPHVRFKERVPQAIGLIRTGDTIQYANMIVESA
jgi:D-ribose pyranase